MLEENKYWSQIQQIKNRKMQKPWEMVKVSDGQAKLLCETTAQRRVFIHMSMSGLKTVSITFLNRVSSICLQ